LRENNLISAEIIFLEFNHCKNYNTKKFQNSTESGGSMGKVGRPKAQIPRNESLTLRFSKFEREKISRVAKQKNLTITEAILQGIDLLEKNKPKITRSQFNQMKGIQPKLEKNSVGLIESDVVMFDK